MNGCCKEVIEPSIKLGRMVTLLKLLACVHFFLILADLFVVDTGFFFLIFVQFIVLLIGISSKSFSHYLFFILICYFNLYIIFQTLGTWFQVGFYKNDSPAYFVFLFVFELFCVFVIFQSYKQSKQEYREKYGFAAGANGGNGIEENIQNNNGNNNNNNGNFIPFQGNGVVVGGN